MLAEFQAKVHAQGETALDAACVVLNYYAIQELSKPGTGLPYLSRRLRGKMKDGKTGKLRKRKATDIHIASAPNEPPAQDIGDLKRAQYVEKIGTLLRAVGNRMMTAAPLTFGGPHRAPRPWMEPALQKCKGLMQTAFENSMKIVWQVK